MAAIGVEGNIEQIRDALLCPLRLQIGQLQGAVPARLQLTEVLPIGILLGLCLLLTVVAQPVMAYMERASASLHQPALYIERVMTAPVVPGVSQGPDATQGGNAP